MGKVGFIKRDIQKPPPQEPNRVAEILRLPNIYASFSAIWGVMNSRGGGEKINKIDKWTKALIPRLNIWLKCKRGTTVTHTE